ncbi:type II toxin-antitoxin system HicA family toxin [Synechocystis sp. LEGE 06083]
MSVPIHGNQDLKIGLLRHFMKQANLSESDL